MRANLILLAALLLSAWGLAALSRVAQRLGMGVEMLAAGLCAALAGAVLMRAVVALGSHGSRRARRAGWRRGLFRV
ncbi:hypothetical protein [Acidocella sp.]|uniref:hypothetical protein n=1 Tax=Acidocella sp. TaxID=50710 RepID=UPI00260D2803|nr:hypothetical protein [Acidocella sp.]